MDEFEYRKVYYANQLPDTCHKNLICSRTFSSSIKRTRHNQQKGSRPGPIDILQPQSIHNENVQGTLKVQCHKKYNVLQHSNFTKTTLFLYRIKVALNHVLFNVRAAWLDFSHDYGRLLCVCIGKENSLETKKRSKSGKNEVLFVNT